MPYQTYEQSIAPTALKGTYGQTLVGQFGRAKDDYVAIAKQAAQAAFPGIAAVDALQPIGDEMGLPQGMGETQAAYVARLLDPFTQWARAGTPLGVLLALHSAGFDGCTLVQQNGKYYQLTLPLNPDPTTNLVIGSVGAAPVVIHSSVTPTRNIPANTPWWYIDANTDCCSRYTLLIPITVILNQARVVFLGTEDGSPSNPWPSVTFTQYDTGFHILVSAPTVTSGIAPASIDPINITIFGCQIQPSSSFAGSVDVTAYRNGYDPLAKWPVFAVDTLPTVRAILNKWAPARMLCSGIAVATNPGTTQYIGFPARTIGNGSVIGPSSVVVYGA